ncbi:MAG: amidohydrolase [uncultured bacterium]|nr:MAG: amidohydrolase [uncultured bacterium]
MFKIYKAEWILPANGQIVEKGAVLVKDGMIFEVLSQEELKDFESCEIINYGKSVITPGFINLHAHLQFTDLNQNNRQHQSPIDFINWIKELMSLYSQLDVSQKENSVKNGIDEALLSGTTCIGQVSKELFDIFNSSKIRTFLFLETFSNNEQTSELEFENLKEKINIIQQNESELVNIGISPHSIYNVHPALWKKIAEFAKENNLLVQTHLAESKAEIRWLEKGYSDIDLIHKFVGWDKVTPVKTGLNPVEYLEELGVIEILGNNLILTHLNQLQESAFEKLAKYNVNIVHCPRSNMILHNKTIDINKIQSLYNLTDRIGIGTDSKFSNYDLNIINEAKFIKNSTGLDLLKLLDMLTINAAKILRLDNKIGSLEKGKEADFLVFKLNDNETYLDFINKENPDSVYIQGKQIVKDKKLT